MRWKLRGEVGLETTEPGRRMEFTGRPAVGRTWKFGMKGTRAEEYAQRMKQNKEKQNACTRMPESDEVFLRER